MKILAPLVGLVLLAMPSILKAEETKLPEEFLMTSVAKITTCLRAQAVGMVKLATMGKELQADEPGDTIAEDHKQTLLKIISTIEDLRDVMNMEKLVGRHMVGLLMTDYKHTADDLEKSLSPIATKTDESMKELLKDAKDLDEFNQVFIPKMNSCTEAMENIGKTAEKFNNGLEKQK